MASIAALGSVKGALPGSVKVQNCPALESLHGLENITAIGSDSSGTSIYLYGNSRMASIFALGSVQTFQGNMEISIERLESLQGLKRQGHETTGLCYLWSLCATMLLPAGARRSVGGCSFTSQSKHTLGI